MQSIKAYFANLSQRFGLADELIVLDTVAKGFAGASLALVIKMGFSFDRMGLAFPASTGSSAKRQALPSRPTPPGCALRYELHWEPPRTCSPLSLTGCNGQHGQGKSMAAAGWLFAILLLMKRDEAYVTQYQTLSQKKGGLSYLPSIKQYPVVFSKIH
ncbi:hypothetical protein DU490_09845 [Halomonas sp. DQ26W]|nr:hypothetical protein DU490_09845 [Halomonas sp. DQ26W]